MRILLIMIFSFFVLFLLPKLIGVQIFAQYDSSYGNDSLYDSSYGNDSLYDSSYDFSYGGGDGSYWDSRYGGGGPTPTPTPGGSVCAAPTILTHSDTNQSGGGTVEFTWSTVSGANQYRVQRQSCSDTSWSTQQTSSSTSFSGSDNSCDPDWRVFVYTSDGSCSVPGANVTFDPGSSYTISGRVYVDSNGNGARDSGEPPYEGATVQVQGQGSDVTDSNGRYSFNNLLSGSYNVRVQLPSGYEATTTNPVLGVSLPPDATVNFGIAVAECSDGIDNNGDGLIDSDDPGCHTDGDPGNPGSYDPNSSESSLVCGTVLSGTVFEDTGGNNCTSGGTPYAGGARITLYEGGSPTGSDTTDGAGAYSVDDNAVCGERTVVISNISGYEVRAVRFDNGTWGTSDLSGFTYGSFDLTANHTLDWCISNVGAWFQTDTGDVRMNNLTNRVPSGDYASIDSSNPSIFYSSNFASEFGSGISSTIGWKIDDEYSYQDDSRNRNGSTSYSFYMNRIAQQNVTTNNIPGCGEDGDCIAAISNLSTGAYHVNGNLTVTSYSHQAGARVLLLVNGDVDIQSNISIPAGSVLIIAAKGDITIDRSIGTTILSSTAPQVSGILTAEGSVIADGDNCSAGSPDRRLNIQGSIVANSLKPFQVGGAGVLVNRRSLCLDDENYPSLYVSPRYDFITQLTDFYKTAYTRWRELAP